MSRRLGNNHMYKCIIGFLCASLTFLAACSTGTAVQPSVSGTAIQPSASDAQAQTSTPVQTENTSTPTVTEQPSITLSHNYVLKSSPESVSSDTQEIRIAAGQSFRLGKVEGIYRELLSEKVNGWIPAWYLDHDKDVVDWDSSKAGKSLLVITKESPLFLAPLRSNDYQDDYELKVGQAVRIIRTYSNWLCVDFVQYDAAIPGDRWIPQDCTAAFSAEACKEGKIKNGADVYDEYGDVVSSDSQDVIVFIQSKKKEIPSRGTCYEVMGPGGFSGYIQTEDFVPNPFQ